MIRVLLLLAFLSFSVGITRVQAQTRVLTGSVKDKKDGQPLVGVSVTVKDSKTGASTDANGMYKVTIPAKGTIVTFTYIGYKSKGVGVTDQAKLDVSLEEDANNLQEITVNIGYGSVRKEALTGSVSSIRGKDIDQFPVSTAAQALAGKLAGVSVTTTEGSPGAEIVIKVRGGSSLTGDNSPLYIVDGIQVENALSILSPNEIQSIDVLKDVASTSIYGSRGANGVIIITTKSGKNGRTVVSFDTYGGFRQIVNELSVMNPYEYVKYQYELYNNNTSQDVKDAFTKRYGTFEDLDIYKNIQNINWQDKVFGRNAWSNTQALNLSGGSEKTTFNASINNTNEDGIMLNSGFKRTFASFRFDHNISNKFKVGLNARYSRQEVDGVGTSNTGSQGNNRLRNSVRYQPYSGGGDSGDQFDADYIATNLTNPITLANQELKFDYTNSLISSAYVQYQILKNLTFKSNLGVTFTDRNTKGFNGPVSGLARNNASLPVVVLSGSSTRTVINTNTLNYKPNLGVNHNLDLLLGEETNKINLTSNASTIKWFPVNITADEAFGSIQKAEPPAGSVQDKPTSNVGGSAQFSVFARVSYGYKSKYLATFNFRTDASSFFAPGKQWGYFPSGQLAWRATEEQFVKDLDLKWLNTFKVRVSYGAAGNNRIQSDLFRAVYLANSTGGGYAASDASVSTGLITGGTNGDILFNPNITWETNISKNLGIDMDLFQRRLSISLDYYDNKTKNLLLLAEIPQITGYKYQQQNVGATQNKGFEVQLNYQAVKSKDFNYNTSLNLSFNRNKILALQNGVTSQVAASGWVNSLNDFLVQVGQPVGQFYGFESDGRYELSDFTSVQNTNGSYTYTLKPNVPNASVLLGNRQPQPGDMKVKKLSSSASMVIGDDDRTVLGVAQPKMEGGFNNQIAYKNFDFTVFMNFSVGSKVYNANKIEFTSQYNVKDNNLLSVMNDRWQNFNANGVKVTDPALLAAMNANTTMWTPTTGNYALYSYAIEDGSFLRISNITLGYSLPQSLIKKTGFISKFRMYATVNNLWTITGYTGYDPEANTRGKVNPLTPGVDYAAYPRSRYILAGINMTF